MWTGPDSFRATTLIFFNQILLMLGIQSYPEAYYQYQYSERKETPQPCLCKVLNAVTYQSAMVLFQAS